MSASQEQKKRPPPIALPPLPRSRHLPGPDAFAIAAQTMSENQHNGPTSKESGYGDKQSAPTSAHQGLPLSQMSDAALPRSNSQKNQARGSPRKSDYASSASASSRHYSTTQSKHSDRNQHAAMAAQAQLEALDEDDRMSRSNKSTTRSRHSDRSAHRAMAAQAHLEIANQDDRTSRSLIEARSERKLFKMMGQVPPTPVDGVVEIPDSYIKTSDLRSQYKSQESEKEQPEKEPPKSPRKKLFGVSLPMFNRASSSAPTPSMPSKAAQVLGTDPKRKPHKIEVRPIKPSGYVRPAIKTPRSDTSKSLPSKLYESQSHSRRQHVGAARRNRTVGRKGHVPHITHITHNKAIDALAELSRRSSSPPTPPEKDTPPDSKPKVQHIRQHSLNHPCDEGKAVDVGMKLEFPSIGSAPALKPKLPTYGTDSPAKFQPYTASDYVKLVERDCIHSTYAQIERVESTDIRQGHFQRMTLDSENVEPQDIPCAVRLSEKILREKRLDLSPDGHLLPRFYSPTDRSPQEFPQGGSPSKNTDPDRLLFVLRPISNIQHMVETLSQGSGPKKNMVPQGEANPLGPESATNKTINSTAQETTSPQKNGDLGSAAQEPRVAEKKEVVMRGGGGGQTGQLQPDHSFSGLSDMFNTLSPFRPGLDRNFTPNCPSAVPSPLNRAPKQQPFPSGNMRVPQTTPRTPKSMEDHFFMTNEHVDVAAKILHDFVAKCHQQEVNTVASKHEQLITKLEHHVEDIKSQINSVSEKADHTSNQNHNVNVKLDKLLGFIKSEVVEPLNTQTKRTADMEVHMKELQKTMKNLQSSMDQKLAETRSGQPMTTGTYPTPVTAQSSYPLMGHRTQPSMVGYFDSPTQDSGGDGSGRLPHAQESANTTAGSDVPRGDNRGRYGGAYNQNWHPRAKDETHPFSGSNPYHLAGNGQYGSGYMGGYPLGFSPTPPGQQYPFPPPNAPK